MARTLFFIFLSCIIVGGNLASVEYTLAQDARPHIEYVAPPSSYPGGRVAIYGSGFGAIQVPLLSRVEFNGVDAGAALYWSDTLVLVSVPEVATSGDVVVITPDGTSDPYPYTINELPETQYRYFAEGCTRAGFEEWITLLNPGEKDLVATVTYLVANGANRIRYYRLPAQSRVNIYVNQEIGSDHDLSLTISSTGFFVAERSLYFQYKGRWTGGHCALGCDELSTTWFFSEGCTREGFETWLALGNPNDTEAVVDVTFFFEDGNVVRQNIIAPPLKRATLFVNEVVGPDKDVAVKVESSLPIVAERPMYFLYRGIWDGGHDSLGALSLSSVWYFAEGTTRAGFEGWLCLGNPGGEDVPVTLRLFYGGGDTDSFDLVIPPSSRKTINLNSLARAGSDFSLEVRGEGGFVAERSQYFNYRGKWTGGSCTLGSPMLGNAWSLAEGCTRAGFETWICLANFSEELALATVIAFRSDGDRDSFTVNLPPHSRTTLDINRLAGGETDVGFQVIAREEVLVERPMYFLYHALWSGGDTAIGYPEGQ
jgi:hypothetical protein